jgi:hypothetical protein
MQTNDPEEIRRISRDPGPTCVDSQLRQALLMCWWVLPPEKRSAAALEAEFRRLAERAIAEMREDASAFGIGGDVPS